MVAMGLVAMAMLSSDIDSQAVLGMKQETAGSRWLFLGSKVKSFRPWFARLAWFSGCVTAGRA